MMRAAATIRLVIESLSQLSNKLLCRKLSLLIVPAGTIELIEDRHDLLTTFGIWIYVLSGLEQREVFGAKFCLQFVYLLGQILGFLAVFLLINLIELITEIEDLAIGLGLSLITSYDAEDRLCQFGSIGRLTLRIQGYGADGQDRNCQQPVHNALVALPS
jgi:hypothetical protein